MPALSSTTIGDWKQRSNSQNTDHNTRKTRNNNIKLEQQIMESSLDHDNPKDANTPYSTNPEYCLSGVVLRSGGGALVCSPPTQCVRRTTQGASDVDSFESPTAPSPSLISSPWPVMDSSWFLSFSLCPLTLSLTLAALPSPSHNTGRQWQPDAEQLSINCDIFSLGGR